MAADVAAAATHHPPTPARRPPPQARPSRAQPRERRRRRRAWPSSSRACCASSTLRSAPRCPCSRHQRPLAAWRGWPPPLTKPRPPRTSCQVTSPRAVLQDARHFLRGARCRWPRRREDASRLRKLRRCVGFVRGGVSRVPMLSSFRNPRPLASPTAHRSWNPCRCGATSRGSSSRAFPLRFAMADCNKLSTARPVSYTPAAPTAGPLGWLSRARSTRLTCCPVAKDSPCATRAAARRRLLAAGGKHVGHT